MFGSLAKNLESPWHILQVRPLHLIMQVTRVIPDEPRPFVIYRQNQYECAMVV